MTNRIKELITTLLEALIKDGKIGVEDGVEERDIDFASEQFDYLESALTLLIELEDNEEGFDFEEFGAQMCKVLHCRDNDVEDVENTIYCLLDRDNLDFTEDEIKQLAKTIIDESKMKKRLTNKQLVLYERAKKEGWFKKIETENVKLSISENVKGLLDDLRQVFPYNYVGKKKTGEQYFYTIYTGDKEFNKTMNQPLRKSKKNIRG